METSQTQSSGIVAAESTTVEAATPHPAEPKEFKVTFNLKREEALALQLFASHDDHRFVLNGVCFELNDQGLTLVATNGRVLGSLHIEQASLFWPEGVSRKQSFIVNCDCLKKLPKAKNPKDSMSVEATLRPSAKPSASGVLAGHVYFVSDRYAVKADVIEGTFPRWREVVPKSDFCPSEYNFNPEYLNLFAMASALLAPKASPSVSIKAHSGDAKIAYSVFIHDRRFYGVLMPVIDSGYSMPSWVRSV